MGETTNEVRSLDDVQRTTVGASSATVTPDQNQDSGDTDRQAAQIRSGIEQTRADMSETIGALQEKLDPARIADQVKGQIREKASEAFDSAKNTVKEATIRGAGKIVSNVTETMSDMTGRAESAVRDTSSSVVGYIRDNPIPFALLGIGAGMLALNRQRSSNSYSSRQTVPANAYGVSQSTELSTAQPSLTDRAKDAMSGVAQTTRQAAGTAVESTREQLNHLSDQTRQGVRVASDRFSNTLQENPMALGIAALAAGALLGLTMPATRVESEYMGEARDRLVDQAKSVAHEAAEKVQRVTEEAGRTLKDAAQKEGLMVEHQASATA